MAARLIISLVVVVLVLCFSWFIAAVLNYYTGHGKALKPHANTNSPPFPGDRFDRVFWFLQVLYCELFYLLCFFTSIIYMYIPRK